MQRFIDASALAVSPVELIVSDARPSALFGLFLPALFGRPPIFGAVLGLRAGVAALVAGASRRRKRIARIERQLPEALDLMGRAMRAGHAFPTALKMVGDEMAEPLGRRIPHPVRRDQLRRADQRGAGPPGRRVPVTDVSYFVVAVMIQRESGGNLAELLDNIASIVRDAAQAARRGAHAVGRRRLSACILTGCPSASGCW